MCLKNKPMEHTDGWAETKKSCSLAYDSGTCTVPFLPYFIPFRLFLRVAKTPKRLTMQNKYAKKKKLKSGAGRTEGGRRGEIWINEIVGLEVELGDEKVPEYCAEDRKVPSWVKR